MIIIMMILILIIVVRLLKATVFAKLSQEHSLSYSTKFSKFESNATSDWLNH